MQHRVDDLNNIKLAFTVYQHGREQIVTHIFRTIVWCIFYIFVANSSKGITNTNDELRSMQGHIKNARSLLTKYGRKEMTDKLFIFLAVVFFLATVLYIIKKRLWSSSMDTDTYNAPQDRTQDPLFIWL